MNSNFINKKLYIVLVKVAATIHSCESYYFDIDVKIRLENGLEMWAVEQMACLSVVDFVELTPSLLASFNLNSETLNYDSLVRILNINKHI